MFRLRFFRLNCALLTAVFLAAASHATAGLITQPSHLGEGNQYRLVFVTSSGTNAVPDGVAYYNDFVTNAANSVPELAALNTDWRAIVSSATFGANENTGINSNDGISIFRLDGQLIGFPDFWVGTINNPINLTELGTIRSSNVWTGSNSDGTPNAHGIDGLFPAVGNSSSTTDWIIGSTFVRETQVFPLYGVSGILTATAVDTPVAAIPEPSTYALLLAGLGIVAFVSKRRRKGQAVAH